MPISGPNIQMPATASQVFDFTRNEKGEIVTISMKPEWGAFFQSLQLAAFASTRNGSTASRPTSTTIGRYVGQPFMDMTLGYPVFLKYTSSNVWVRGDGTVV